MKEPDKSGINDLSMQNTVEKGIFLILSEVREITENNFNKQGLQKNTNYLAIPLCWDQKFFLGNVP